MKKYYLFSTSEGCAVNLNDSQMIATHLESTGYQRVADIESADYIIANTCAVNDKMAKITKDKLSDLRDRYPQKKVITMGCFPTIHQRDYQRLFAFPFLSPKNINEISCLLPSEEKAVSVTNSFDQFHDGANHHKMLKMVRGIFDKYKKLIPSQLYRLIAVASFNPRYYTLPVGTGCLGECSYCAIKYARGRAISRSLSEIDGNLRQTNERDIWVLAGDIGCWGLDIGLTVEDLFETFLKYSDKKYVFNYFGPEWLVRYRQLVVSAIATKKIIYLAIPIQSGSNRVLKRARRNYQIEDVLKIIPQLRKGYKTLIIKTDYIVGLPGEGWGDFLKSLRTAWYFDLIYVQVFSPHPNTPACNESDVPKKWEIFIRMLLFKLVNQVIHTRTLVTSIISKEKN